VTVQKNVKIGERNCAMCAIQNKIGTCFYSEFHDDESGAVTSEFVLLTAMAIAISAAVISSVSGGASTISARTAQGISSVADASYDTDSKGSTGAVPDASDTSGSDDGSVGKDKKHKKGKKGKGKNK
jgi:Flp pilus assembly pilin Flp